MPRAQTIEVFAPTAGIKADTPSHIADPRGMRSGLDSRMYYGCNEKMFGTTIYSTGTGSVLGAPINFLFEAKFPNTTVLQVFTHTGVSKYNSTTDSLSSDGQSFSGTFSNYWSGFMYNDQFVYTNGIDPIQIKPDAASTGIVMNSAVATDTYKAWALAGLQDHLNLYHTIENGTEHYKRVRWTKKGQLSPSGTDDFVAGTAGAIDLNDAEGAIMTAVPLEGAMAIYCERSILVQFWVGGQEVYRFPKTVSGVGTPSRRGAVSHKGINYFISHENFHAYRGGDDIRNIGDPIKRLAFGAINNSSIANSFVEYDEVEEEVLFNIPTTGELPDTQWVFKVTNESWTKRIREYTAQAQFTRRSGLTIGELIGTIGEQNFKFGEAFTRAESLIRIYGDQSGRLVKQDRTTFALSINGTTSAQHYIYETPDYTNANEIDPVDKDKVDFTSTEKRWVQARLDMLGSGTATVSYSTDLGQSYTVFDESPVTLSPGGTNHVLDMDVSGRALSIKIENTGSNDYIGVKYVAADFVPGGPH